MAKKRLAIRVICIDPPLGTDSDVFHFGLQDKNKQLLTGDKSATNTLMFECELDVKQHTDDTPNFTGSYTHGSRGERFLYLTLMSPQSEIIRRIKIPLKTITWEQVQTVLEDNSAILQVTVGGQRSGTVPLLGDGWVIDSRSSDN